MRAGASTASGCESRHLNWPHCRRPNYAYRNLGGGSLGGASIVRNPSAPVDRITVNASCDGEDGACPAGVAIAGVAVSSASILLDDLSTPSVADLTGSLLSGRPLTGSAEVSFQAQDEGPGLYSAWLVVDGQAQSAILLDSNNGACRDLGPTSQSARSFSSPTPCAASASASLTLNTAGLPDGTHAVKLMVDDAAGDATLAWSSTIETQNAPTVLSPPSIAGGAKIGRILTVTPALFSAPEGAGALSEEGGRWMRCSAAAAGGGGDECAPIADASGLSYTPTSEDAGYRLLYQSTARDADGSTSSDSPPTPVIAEPASSPPAPSPPSSGSGGGRSTGQGSGESITRTVEIVAGGLGGAGGAGGSAQSTAAATGAAGSVSVRVDGSRDGARPPWRIGLRIERHPVRRGVRVRVFGSVRGGVPRPSRLRLVYLRVRGVWSTRSGARHRRRHREGRRHRRYGRWVTLIVLRTGADGAFTVSHVFRLYGRRAYQVQAFLGGEDGHQGGAGRSRILTVRECASRPIHRRHRDGRQCASSG